MRVVIRSDIKSSLTGAMAVEVSAVAFGARRDANNRRKVTCDDVPVIAIAGHHSNDQ